MSRELGVLRTYLVHSTQETLYSSFVCIFFLGVSTGGLEFVVLLSQPPECCGCQWSVAFYLILSSSNTTSFMLFITFCLKSETSKVLYEHVGCVLYFTQLQVAREAKRKFGNKTRSYQKTIKAFTHTHTQMVLISTDEFFPPAPPVQARSSPFLLPSIKTTKAEALFICLQHCQIEVLSQGPSSPPVGCNRW